ncbi:14361_t:CDS:2 [Racocetra persica]|uniref:14361_t:CDS:1 n=1 Tax=Racocetra persica TaxID=160502 RepID=A0ACA9L045_9GLOM|nr:14361_t:CDS:2 [Racocetra persica]
MNEEKNDEMNEERNDEMNDEERTKGSDILEKRINSNLFKLLIESEVEKCTEIKQVKYEMKAKKKNSIKKLNKKK